MPGHARYDRHQGKLIPVLYLFQEDQAYSVGNHGHLQAITYM